MSKIDDGAPAFPRPAHENGIHYEQDGMSLRDWFASQFLAGAATDNSPLDLSNAADQFDVDNTLREHWGHVSRAAYIAADAMIAARKGCAE